MGSSGTPVPVDATLFINNTLLDVFFPPPHHNVLVVEGRVAGLLIAPAVKTDSGTVYSCRVQKEDQVLSSLNSTLFVGGATYVCLSLSVVV